MKLYTSKSQKYFGNVIIRGAQFSWLSISHELFPTKYEIHYVYRDELMNFYLNEQPINSPLKYFILFQI